jgi:hypothetical protein
VRFVDPHRAERRRHRSLVAAADRHELLHRPRLVGREPELGPRSGDPEERDAVRRAHARADELLGRHPRPLFVARCDVLLVEDQDVEVAAREGVVRRDLRRHRAHRRVDVRLGGFGDALKQHERQRAPRLLDDQLLAAQIRDRAARFVDHPQVEAHQVDPRLEGDLRGGRQGQGQGEQRGAEHTDEHGCLLGCTGICDEFYSYSPSQARNWAISRP